MHRLLLSDLVWRLDPVSGEYPVKTAVGICEVKTRFSALLKTAQKTGAKRWEIN
jgi:hypothetical protein